MPLPSQAPTKPLYVCSNVPMLWLYYHIPIKTSHSNSPPCPASANAPNQNPLCSNGYFSWSIYSSFSWSIYTFIFCLQWWHTVLTYYSVRKGWTFQNLSKSWHYQGWFDFFISLFFREKNLPLMRVWEAAESWEGCVTIKTRLPLTSTLLGYVARNWPNWVHILGFEFWPRWI